ncbi:MAG TPA: hypothetical protein VF263_05335, partial [Longimicrobiaceae bacterium]
MKARATRAIPLAEAAARLAARPSLSPELRGQAAEAARLGHDFARVAVPSSPADGSGGVIQRVTEEQRKAASRLRTKP